MATFISNGEPITQPSPQYDIPIVCNNGAVRVSPNLFTRVGETLDKYYNASGVEQNGVYPNYSFAHTDFLKVKPNTTYTFGFKAGYSPIGATNHRVIGWTSSKSYVKEEANVIESVGTEVGTLLYDTFTTSATTEYITINFIYTPLEAEIQLVQGSSLPATYRPYGEIYTDGTVETVTDSNGLAASAERLLAVGDYKDTQSVINGQVTRNIGIKVLDGTEDWTQVSGNASFALVVNDFVSLGLADKVLVYSTHFQGVPATATWVNYENLISFTYSPSGDSKTFRVRYLNNTKTLEEFKQFLAEQYANGTPVICVYYKTATTETVTGQFLSKSPVTQAAGSISSLPIAITESQKTVPTPTQPLQINCNNGVVKVSKNLFDVDNNLLEGYYIESSTGILKQSTDGSSSCFKDFLPSKPNVTYTMSRINVLGNTVMRMWAYDKDKNPISLVFNSATGAIEVTGTTPNGTAYIRCSFGSIPSRSQNVQLEVGSTATPYMPYGQIYTDGTTETVEITGKNLFDKNAVTEGYIYNAQLEYVTSDIASLSDYISVVAGQSYTFTGYKEATGNYNIRINYFNTNKEIQSQDVQVVRQGNYSFTITIPNGIKYLRYSFRTEMADSQQIEQGSTATTYEPYTVLGTATSENLFKIGTYQDVQSVIDGGVTRNVGIKVLDGSENWALGTSFYTQSSDFLHALQATHSCICTHYQGISTNVVGVGDSNTIKVGTNSIGSSTVWGRIYLYADRSLYTTAQDFADYLKEQYNAGHPVVVIYPLNTPTTETVTPQPMNIQEGTNNVTITQASMDDLELEVKYKAGVAVTITEIQNAQLDDNVEVIING